MAFARSVHLLRSPKGVHAGFHQFSKTYVVACPFRGHATMMRKYVHEGTAMTLANHADVPTTGIDVVLVDEIAELHVSKAININRVGVCDIEEMPFDELILYPFTRNLGVAFVLDLLRETKSHLIFEAQVVDAAGTAELFRPTLR